MHFNHFSFIMKKHFYLLAGLLSISLLTPALAQNVLVLPHLNKEEVRLYAIDQKREIAHYQANALQSSYNGKAQIFCAADVLNDEIWMAKISDQNTKTVYTAKQQPADSGLLLPEAGGISVDDQGHCLFSADRRTNQLQLASIDGSIKKIQFNVDKSENHSFNEPEVQSIIYNPNTGFLVMGKYAYAVMPANGNTIPDKLANMTPNGKIQGVEVFSLSGQGILSPDGKTLYTFAEVFDEANSVFRALIVLEVKSGKLQKIYLPQMKAGHEENISRFDQSYDSIVSGVIGITADGKTLYTNAYKESDVFGEEGVFLDVAIDVETAKITPITLPQTLMEAEFIGIHQSTGHLIFKQFSYDNPVIMIWDTQTQQIVQSIGAE